MKKLSLVLGFVLVAGFSFAQTHISTVVESGVNQHATVTQNGPGDITSNVNQSNADNVAIVTQINPNLQTANDILSTVDQSGISNLATVVQKHTGILAVPVAGKIEAHIIQSGNNNQALQDQGPHNKQGTTYALIDQSGSWNKASQNQLKYGNDARIYQSGNGNEGQQAQDATLLADYDGSMNTALLNQSGNDNFATQKQDGWANDVTAYQSGNNNSSIQTQNISWVSDAFVSQSGSWNKATQTQSGPTVGTGVQGRLNSAKIEQSSNGNEAIQLQKSEGARASAVYDPLNRAEIYQMGGDNNYAKQIQDMPTGTFANATDANVGIISQSGNNNIATQDQTGGFNYGTVTQTGSWNEAHVTQSQSF